MKEDFVKEVEKLLQEEVESGDPEIAHSNADKILCDFLRDLGYNKVVDTFEKVTKWYA